MNVTVHSATPEGANGIINEIIEQARLLGEEEVNIYAPADVLPLLARAAYERIHLPAQLQFHELVNA